MKCDRIIIMAAGGYKRFTLLDEAGQRIPKPLAPFPDHELKAELPNLARTALWAETIASISPIYITHPPGQKERFAKALAPHFPAGGIRWVEGHNELEGFKYTNCAGLLTPGCAVLFGDCRFELNDLVRVLEAQPPESSTALNQICTLFGRDDSHSSVLGKGYKEAYAWRVWRPGSWYDAVLDDFARHQENATSWTLFASLQDREAGHRVEILGPWTDDYDTEYEYQLFRKKLGALQRNGQKE